MSQSLLTIGTIGHVDHGKTTLTSKLSGKWTDTHSEELKRGITIKLGYADVKVYKFNDLPEPDCYSPIPKNPKSKVEGILERKISLVDCPGHESLMATVISASSLIDGALFVIAANESCPQPQTMEHLMVLKTAGIKKIVVVQTKVDLVPKEKALEHYKQIKDFLKNTEYADSPVVPVVASSGLNLDALLYSIEKEFPTPKKDETKEPHFIIARSFDVNKPGTEIEKIQGGVIGGSLVQGILKKGDVIEIVPGYMEVKKEKETYNKIKTKITKLVSDGEELEELRPGCLAGISTELDPALTRADLLAGNLLGLEGKVPAAVSETLVTLQPLDRKGEFTGIVPGEKIVVGFGTTSTLGQIEKLEKGGKYKIRFKKPIPVIKGDHVGVMRVSGNRWKVFGIGIIN
ncbi:Translation initiation factor 2 subunit gamma [uncultured archaeon]|nr:Translation initiation factor 2 subunit gamma [uncultured archaeon]